MVLYFLLLIMDVIFCELVIIPLWQVYTVPHPDVFWYRLNGMGTQKNGPKKVLVTLFPYILQVKPR